MTTVLGCHYRQIQLIYSYVFTQMKNIYFTTGQSTSARISGVTLSQLRLDFAMRCLNEVDLSNDYSVRLSLSTNPTH